MSEAVFSKSFRNGIFLLSLSLSDDSVAVFSKSLINTSLIGDRSSIPLILCRGGEDVLSFNGSMPICCGCSTSLFRSSEEVTGLLNTTSSFLRLGELPNTCSSELDVAVFSKSFRNGCFKGVSSSLEPIPQAENISRLLLLYLGPFELLLEDDAARDPRPTHGLGARLCPLTEDDADGIRGPEVVKEESGGDLEGGEDVVEGEGVGGGGAGLEVGMEGARGGSFASSFSASGV